GIEPTRRQEESQGRSRLGPMPPMYILFSSHLLRSGRLRGGRIESLGPINDILLRTPSHASAPDGPRYRRMPGHLSSAARQDEPAGPITTRRFGTGRLEVQ